MDQPALADPTAVIARMHEGPPVLFDAQLQAWLVISDRTVREGLRHPALSARATPAFFSAMPVPVRAQFADLERHFDHWMVFSDADRHRRQRSAIQPLLSPGAVADLHPRIDAFVRDASEALPPGAEIDFLAQFARPVARKLVGSLLSIGPSELSELLTAAEDLIAFISTAVP
ncbi:MAG: hypothetical protein ACRC0L_06580, partial [Angustibacter sp.]